MAPEPSATVRNTADGEEAHRGVQRRHENSGFGAKPGLPIHTTIPRSLAEVTASGKVHPLREVGLLEMSGIRNITLLKGRRVGFQATGSRSSKRNRPPDLAPRISLDANPCVNRFNQRRLGKSSATPPGSSPGTR